MGYFFSKVLLSVQPYSSAAENGTILPLYRRERDETRESISYRYGSSCQQFAASQLSTVRRIGRQHSAVSGISRQHLVISRQPSAVSRQPSAVSRQPSAVSHQPSAVSSQQSAVSRQPPAVSRQPPAVSRQPSAVNSQLQTVLNPRPDRGVSAPPLRFFADSEKTAAPRAAVWGKLAAFLENDISQN